MIGGRDDLLLPLHEDTPNVTQMTDDPVPPASPESAAPVATRQPDHARRLRELEALAQETFGLWTEIWVGFSWRCYYMAHTRRVRDLCLHVAPHEGGDALVLAYASLLHDITKRYDGDVFRDAAGNRLIDANGLWQNELLLPADGRRNAVTELFEGMSLHGALHSESGARVADALLRRMGLADGLRAAVCQVIRDHVRPANPEGTDARDWPVESQILHDADTLDANMGLIAFYRNVQIHTCRKRLEQGAMTIQDYLGYLPKWLGMKEVFIERMTTRTGRQRAVERQRRNEHVYAWLSEEMRDLERGRRGGLVGIIEYFMSTNEDPDLERDRRYLRDVWLAERDAEPAAREFCRLLDLEVAGLS